MVRAVETDKEIIDLEKLRQEVFNIKGLNVNETAAFKEIKKKKALGIACYEEGKIVSGCILTGNRENLYIDWIFTDENYRNRGKATKLLDYIDKNKNLIESYLGIDYSFIKIDSIKEVKEFYKKRGFKDCGKSHYITKVV